MRLTLLVKMYIVVLFRLTNDTAGYTDMIPEGFEMVEGDMVVRKRPKPGPFRSAYMYSFFILFLLHTF